jgi:cell wall-associated NlpC family hydrolase
MRHSDWVSALDAYFTTHKDAPFSYDQSKGLDCCTFAFGAIEAQTGIDIGKAFRGNYNTRKESLRVIHAYSGKASLESGVEALMNEHRFPEIPLLRAQRGDAVLIRKGQRYSSLGIVALNGREILTISNKGIWRLPLTSGFRAWSLCQKQQQRSESAQPWLALPSSQVVSHSP